MTLCWLAFSVFTAMLAGTALPQGAPAGQILAVVSSCFAALCWLGLFLLEVIK